MKMIDNILEANKLLQNYKGARAKIFMFSPTFGRMAVKLIAKNVSKVVYIVGFNCEYIVGNFSFDQACFEIERNGETTEIIDKQAGFKLTTSGGFTVLEGKEEEFGTTFNDFIVSWDNLEE